MLLVIFTTALLLCAIGAMAISAYLNSTAFRRIVLLRLNTAIPGSVAVGRHHISLPGGRMTLHDTVIAAANGRHLATVDRLQVGISWPALARREFRITRLRVTMAEVALTYDDQDHLPLIQALSPSRPPSNKSLPSTPWPMRVDDLKIEAGAVILKRPARQWDATATRIEISGQADLTGPSGRISISMARLARQGQGKGAPPYENLAMVVEYTPSATRPMRLEVSASDSRLSIQGEVDWKADTPQLDLEYAMDLDLALVRALLSEGPILAGRCKGRGRIRGLLTDPDITMGLAVNAGRVNHIDFDRMNLDARLAQRIITLASIRTSGNWGEVDISGSMDMQPMFARDWREAVAGLESPAYDLKIEGRRLRPDLWPTVSFPFQEGQWQVQAHAVGRGVIGAGISGRVDIAAETIGARMTAGSRAMDGKLSARLSWTGQVLDIEDCTAVVGGNRLSANGRIDMAARQLNVRAGLEVDRLDELGAMLDLAAPAGRATLSMHGQGAVTMPTFKATLLAEEVARPDWTMGRVLVEAELLPDGNVSFSRLVLENQGSLVQGHGTLALLDADKRPQTDPAISAVLDFEQLEPADFHALEDFQGRFDGHLELGGSLRHLNADLDLAPSGLHWQGMDGRVRGKARWDDGLFTVSNLYLSVGDSLINLQGRASWRQPQNERWLAQPVVHAVLAAKALWLQDFRDDWSGRLALQAEMDGPLTDLQGTFSIEGRDLKVGLQPVHALEARGRLEDHRLHVDRMTVSPAAGQNVTAQGWYGFDRDFRLSLEGTGIDLSAIAALQRAYPVSGRLDLRMDGSGSLSQPNFSGNLKVSEPMFKNQGLQDFHAQLSMQGRQIDLEADLNFKVKARAGLDSGDFDLQAVFDGTDLTPYLALGAGPDWSGRLSGGLQASGDWHSPLEARLSAALRDLQFSYRSIPLVRAEELNIELKEGAIDLPATRLRILEQGHLTLQASGILPKEIDGRIDGRLPLAALAPFTELLSDASGNIDIRMRANGPLPDVPWEADLTLADIGMAVPGLSHSIHDLGGRLKINAGSIKVESLSGRMDGGRFALNGRVRLEDLQPVQGRLDLSARSLPLHWPGTMDLVMHGDLRLEGKPRGAALTGQLDLVEGTYYKDVRLNLLSAVTRPKRRRPTPVVDRSPPWMEAVGLDVAIGYRNPLQVDNNLAHLRIAPDLRLIGTLADPVLNGRAQVTDGELIYRRKSFAVERGVVDFINPHAIEPTLDIVSTAQIRQWKVSLAVVGTPDEMQLKLSSDPPEADNDILSLILLGRTNKELAQGEGGETRTTTQMLATLLATAWGEDVKNTTGMDILELETGARDDADSADRTQLTVGKRLSRRLTLKYALESNRGDMIQKAISEYRFLEHLLVSGFQDSRGDYGGELLFRIEF